MPPIVGVVPGASARPLSAHSFTHEHAAAGARKIVHVPPARLAPPGPKREQAIEQAIREKMAVSSRAATEVYRRESPHGSLVDRYLDERSREVAARSERSEVYLREKRTRPGSAPAPATRSATRSAAPQPQSKHRQAQPAAPAAGHHLGGVRVSDVMTTTRATTRAAPGSAGARPGHLADCLCVCCKDLERNQRFKADRERAEREAELRYARDIKLAAEEAERAEALKRSASRAEEREAMEVNKELVAKRRSVVVGKKQDMGYLLEGRAEPASDALKREKLRNALDGQIEDRQARQAEAAARSRAIEKAQAEENLRLEAEARARSIELKRQQQSEQREALSRQISFKPAADDYRADGHDGFFKMSDEAAAARARAARAREIQDEQRRLMEQKRSDSYYSTVESKEAARRAMAEEAERAEAEKRAALAKKEEARLEMQRQWAQAQQDKERRALSAKKETYGTGLQIGELEGRDQQVGGRCCRCGGNLPDGCIVPPSRRPKSAASKVDYSHCC
jgi:hypothetical protein